MRRKRIKDKWTKRGAQNQEAKTALARFTWTQQLGKGREAPHPELERFRVREWARHAERRQKY